MNESKRKDRILKTPNCHSDHEDRGGDEVMRIAFCPSSEDSVVGLLVDSLKLWCDTKMRP
jgi:hypothetical protein